MPIDRLALLAIDVVVNSGRAAVQMRNLRNTFRRNTQAVEHMNNRMTNAFIGTGIFFTVKQLITDTINVVDDLVKSFVELETILVDIDKIARTGNLQKLADSFFRISENLSIASFKEIGQVMAAAARSGARLGEGLEELTETAVRFAKVSGDITSQEAALGLARIADNFNLSQQDIEKLGAAIDTLSDSFTVTSGEILKTTARMAGIGQIARMTAAETAALSTAILKTGVSQTVTRTAVTRLFTELQQQPLRAAAALKLTEEQAKNFADTISRDFLSGIKQFIDQLDRVGSVRAQETLKELGISSSRVQQVLARLRVDWGDVTQAVQVANKAFGEGTALLEKQFEIMQTGAARLQVLSNNWDQFKASLINSDAVINTLSGVVSKLNELTGTNFQLDIQGLERGTIEQRTQAVLSQLDRVKKRIAELRAEDRKLKATGTGFGLFDPTRPFKQAAVVGELQQMIKLQSQLSDILIGIKKAEQEATQEKKKQNKAAEEQLRLEKQARDLALEQKKKDIIAAAPQFGQTPLQRQIQAVDRQIEAFVNKINEAGIGFGEVAQKLREVKQAAEGEKQRLRREDAAKQLAKQRDFLTQMLGKAGQFGEAINMLLKAQQMLNNPFFQQAPELRNAFGGLLGAQIDALGKGPRQQRQFKGLTQVWKDAQLKTNKDDPLRQKQLAFAKAALQWIKFNEPFSKRMESLLEEINRNLKKRGRIGS